MTLYTIQERRGTAAAWALANTVLKAGQVAAELDSGKFKLGDGTSSWSQLPYFIPEDQIDALIEASRLTEINVQTVTSYTLILSDASKFITINTSAPSVLHVPENIDEAFPIGTLIEGAQLGSGQLSFLGDGAVELLGTPGLFVADQYGTFALRKLATDTWIVYGRLGVEPE